MSRYRIWIITGLALLSWLLFFATAAVIWNGISTFGGSGPGAAGRATAQARIALEHPG